LNTFFYEQIIELELVGMTITRLRFFIRNKLANLPLRDMAPLTSKIGRIE